MDWIMRGARIILWSIRWCMLVSSRMNQSFSKRLLVLFDGAGPTFDLSVQRLPKGP
jgi:hypothetical protein